MKNVVLSGALPILLLGAIAACGGSVQTGTGGSAPTTSTSTASTGSTGSAGAGGTMTSSTTGTSSASCETQCMQLGCVAGSEVCAADAGPVDCLLVDSADVGQVCGVPFADPGVASMRSMNVEEYAGSGPPDLSCLAPGGYPAPPGVPETVTMNGHVRILSHGCESKSVSIEVHRVKRTGGADDGAIDALVGAPVTTSADCKSTGLKFDDSNGNCGIRYLCPYSYAGVPTETELIVKTSGAAWATMFEYNVYLPSSAVTSGAVARDLRALDADDYVIFPQAALGGPVAPGHGMILGEVHDCGDVRLAGAVVNVDVQKKLLAYTTSNETYPLPDLAADVTSELGMYLALDVSPGPARVAAAGKVAGELRTLGFARVQVMSDAVSLVTFHGLLPFQVP